MIKLNIKASPIEKFETDGDITTWVVNGTRFDIDNRY